MKTTWAWAAAAALGVLFIACGPGAAERTGTQRSAVVDPFQPGTLLLDVAASGPAAVGQTETITAVVTNPTTQVAVNAVAGIGVQEGSGSMVSVRATSGGCARNSASSFVCRFGNMARGATITLTAIVVPSATGVLSLATGVSEGAPGTVIGSTDDTTTLNVAPGTTDLQLTGSASLGQPARGGDFQYRLQVKNGGPVVASAVTLSDALPSAVALRAVAAPPGATCSESGQLVTCELGDVAVGAQAEVVIDALAPAVAGNFTDVASVIASSPDDAPANDSIAVAVQVR